MSKDEKIKEVANETTAEATVTTPDVLEETVDETQTIVPEGEVIEASETVVEELKTPREKLVAAGGFVSYETVDKEVIDLPYLDDKVTFEVDSPDEIIFGKVKVEMDALGMEGFHLYIGGLMKFMKERYEMQEERMNFIYGLMNGLDKLVTQEVSKHANEKYPDFMDLIRKDVASKKKKEDDDIQERIKNMTPEQKAKIKEMVGE